MRGIQIESKDGKGVLQLDDLVIDAKDGLVVLLLLDHVPGRDGASVAVPFDKLTENGNFFTLDASAARLASAPDFVAPDLTSEPRTNDIYRYFGVQPYWIQLKSKG